MAAKSNNLISVAIATGKHDYDELLSYKPDFIMNSFNDAKTILKDILLVSKKTFSITCPNCSAVQDVELYEVVDICAEPDKKEEIMCNKFNRTSCIDCGEDFRIDLPILYKDERHGIFYSLGIKTADISIENIIEEFDEIVSKIESKRDLLNIRLVFTRE